MYTITRTWSRKQIHNTLNCYLTTSHLSFLTNLI